MKKKTPKIIKETFTMDPERGAAAALMGLSRPGYKMQSLDRKGKKCVVTYVKI
jgi:hypothetical protein